MSAPNLAELVRLATALVDQIGDLAARDQANYERGWREAAPVFFNHGVEVGRQQLSNELLEVDRRRAKYISGLVNLPSYTELETRRWGGRRQDFGKARPGDFAGVPPEVDAMFFCPRCQEARSWCTCKAAE